MISFLSYTLGAYLANRLDPRLSRSVTDALSLVQYHCRRGSRRVVLSNMRLALGADADPRELRRLAKNVFRNFGMSIYYFLRFPRRPQGELRGICDYAGIDAVLAKLHAAGGFIIAGPHVGPWEAAGTCLSALGIEIHTVALDHPSARVTRFFTRQRALAGIVCHPVVGSLPVLSQALSKGKAVALLIDRTYEKNRRTFEIFGREAALPFGHAALAVRCRVPVLTVACVFSREGTLRFVFEGPHHPDPSLGENEAAEDIHARCRRDMESFIRRYPDQWFNFKPFVEVGE